MARIINAISRAWKRTGRKDRPRGPKRILWSILRILLLAYAGVASILFLFQSRFVYFPTKDIEETPKDVGLKYADVVFSTEDGVGLHGWFVPAHRERARAVVLFCHGNGGNISHRLQSIHLFHRLGYDTFIFDYRGYGKSEGKPTEKGTYLDTEAAWNYLLTEKQAAPEEIIVFGRSLGGAIAAQLARNHSPAGLIVESSFTSVPDLGSEMFPFLPVRIISRFDYDTVESVRETTCPLLVVHSRDDDLIPFAHGRRIFDAANEPKQFLEITGSHNEGFLDSLEEYSAALEKFISSCLESKSAPL